MWPISISLLKTQSWHQLWARVKAFLTNEMTRVIWFNRCGSTRTRETFFDRTREGAFDPGAVLLILRETGTVQILISKQLWKSLLTTSWCLSDWPDCSLSTQWWGQVKADTRGPLVWGRGEHINSFWYSNIWQCTRTGAGHKATVSRKCTFSCESVYRSILPQGLVTESLWLVYEFLTFSMLLNNFTKF